MRFLRVVRQVLGFMLMLSGGTVAGEGGLSRMAKYGIPPTPNWHYLALGLTLLAGGVLLFRPLPWTRRPN